VSADSRKAVRTRGRTGVQSAHVRGARIGRAIAPRARSSRRWPRSATCRRTLARRSRSRCSSSCRPRSPPSSPCRSIRAAPNTRPSGKPRRHDQVQANVTQAWGQLEAAKGADRCRPVAGHRRRGRAQRRARGCPRRPAHHARRVQCPAGSRQRPRVVASYTVLAATGARSHRRSSGSRSRSTSGSLPAGA
jgi:hypothetical protein